MNNSKTAKKLDDVIRTKMEIEENNEILLQQLKQLQAMQSLSLIHISEPTRPY